MPQLQPCSYLVQVARYMQTLQQQLAYSSVSSQHRSLPNLHYITLMFKVGGALHVQSMAVEHRVAYLMHIACS